MLTTDNCTQCKCPKWAKRKDEKEMERKKCRWHTQTLNKLKLKCFFVLIWGRMQISHFTNWITWKAGKDEGAWLGIVTENKYITWAVWTTNAYSTLFLYNFLLFSFSFFISNNNKKKHQENNNETNLLFWSLSVLLSGEHNSMIWLQSKFHYLKKKNFFIRRKSQIFSSLISFHFILKLHQITRLFISGQKINCYCKNCLTNFFRCHFCSSCVMWNFNVFDCPLPFQ